MPSLSLRRKKSSVPSVVVEAAAEGDTAADTVIESEPVTEATEATAAATDTETVTVAGILDTDDNTGPSSAASTSDLSSFFSGSYASRIQSLFNRDRKKGRSSKSAKSTRSVEDSSNASSSNINSSTRSLSKSAGYKRESSLSIQAIHRGNSASTLSLLSFSNKLRHSFEDISDHASSSASVSHSPTSQLFLDPDLFDHLTNNHHDEEGELSEGQSQLQSQQSNSQPNSSSSGIFSQEFDFPAPSSTKLPHTKFKLKSVSKLFSSESANERRGSSNDNELELSAQSSGEVRKSTETPSLDGHPSTAPLASQVSFMSSPSENGNNDHLKPSTARQRPFPMIRSLSSRSQLTDSTPSNEESKTLDPAANNSVNRPRSKTLPSIDQQESSNNLQPLTRSSITGLFSAKLRSESDTTGLSISRASQSRRPSPSPRPSISPKEPPRIISLPPRQPDDTVETYYEKIKDLKLGSSMAVALVRNMDKFHIMVLEEYMKIFDFADDPLDMALRKFLMSVRLPKEAQQIDRVLETFAIRYKNCNPDIYVDSDQVHILVFSMVILHTDVFNHNNKNKMQKTDYLRNTAVRGVPKDVLECFYDNITYTPFIRTDEDFNLNGVSSRPLWNRRSSSFGRNSKDLIDPYALILEGRLDVLRPSLSTVLNFNDPYRYLPIPSKEDFKILRKDFSDGPYLQLVSERSRPGAFLSPETTDSPQDSDPGLVDIKVVKIGIIYRQETRRVIPAKKAWKEWGAILTASKLYLFKDVSWIQDSILSKGDPLNTGIIRAPIDGFHPSAVLSTVDMVTVVPNLSSTGQDLHQKPHCFLLAGRGGSQDWFAGNSEQDSDDWMMKINYASSFNTYHVGIHGARDTDRIIRSRRLKSLRRTNSDSSVSVNSEVTNITNSSSMIALPKGEAAQLAEVHKARHQAVKQKLEEIRIALSAKENQLEEQIRWGKHLKLLAPIQQRTRESVILSAGRLSAKINWLWLDSNRLRCYRDFFEIEEQVENELCEDFSKERSPEASSPYTASHLSLDFDSIGGFIDLEVSPSSQSIPSTNSNNVFHQKEVDSEPLGLETRLESKLVLKDTSREYNSVERRDSNVKRSTSRVSSESAKSNSAINSGSKLVVTKGFQRSLRDSGSKRRQSNSQATESTRSEQVQRTPSLMRKTESGFTLHGKKFSVVQVSPDFATNADRSNNSSHSLSCNTQENDDETHKNSQKVNELN